jgi:hypothetical protein
MVGVDTTDFDKTTRPDDKPFGTQRTKTQTFRDTKTLNEFAPAPHPPQPLPNRDIPTPTPAQAPAPAPVPVVAPAPVAMPGGRETEGVWERQLVEEMVQAALRSLGTGTGRQKGRLVSDDDNLGTVMVHTQFERAALASAAKQANEKSLLTELLGQVPGRLVTV